MRGSSAESRHVVLEALDRVLDGVEAESAATLGDELFAVVGLLDSEPGLRRAATDPATPAEARKALVTHVFADRVSDATGTVLESAAERRWSASRDLADTLEHAGVLAHVTAAQVDDRLDEVEDELFRFGRIVASDRDLRGVLGDRTTPLHARQQLVEDLLSDKTTAATRRLAVQATAGRHRSLAAGLHEFVRIAAHRRNRLVASVTVAQPLSGQETDRLAEALAGRYGQKIHLNMIVDPSVLGGARVEIGDDVFDGTMHTRLENVRRRLAG